MNLEKYKELSSRTNSPVDKIEINPVLLMNSLNMFVHSARLLEQIKKFIFYGKPFDKNNLVAALRNIAESHRRLQFTSLESADQELLIQRINIDANLFHAILGVASESGELLETLKFDGSKPNETNIAEELGDQHWYQALLVRHLGFDWGSVLDANIEKLQKRYPHKFTPEDAIIRDTNAEMKAVENHLKPAKPSEESKTKRKPSVAKKPIKRPAVKKSTKKKV